MDFVSDQSFRHINRLNSLVTVPDFVKQSSVDPDALSSLTTNQFADRVNREFPIDEPGHVYLSYAYAKSANLQRPGLTKAIRKAGELFGISKDLDGIDEAFTSTKSASAEPSRFAISLETAKGTQNFYPLNTADQVQDAVIKMAQDRYRIPLPLWVDGCREVVKAASEHGLPRNYVSREILEYGEEKYADFEHVKFAAAARMALTSDEVYVQIAEAAEADETGEMDKYAELWFQTDLQNGIERYTRDTEDPYRTFYSGIRKSELAAKAANYVLLADTPTPVSALASVTKDLLAKHFPNKQASDIGALVKRASTETGETLDSDIQALDAATQKALLALLVETC